MFPVGFEPAIPTSEPPQTHALDLATSGTGKSVFGFRIDDGIEGLSIAAYVKGFRYINKEL
jgi:hypothetical protein